MLQNEIKVEFFFFQSVKEAAPEAGLPLFSTGVGCSASACTVFPQRLTGKKSSNPQTLKASPGVPEQFGKPRTPGIPCSSAELRGVQAASKNHPGLMSSLHFLKLYLP